MHQDDVERDIERLIGMRNGVGIALHSGCDKISDCFRLPLEQVVVGNQTVTVNLPAKVFPTNEMELFPFFTGANYQRFIKARAKSGNPIDLAAEKHRRLGSGLHRNMGRFADVYSSQLGEGGPGHHDGRSGCLCESLALNIFGLADSFVCK